MMQTNLEVGYGMAKGKDASAVGKKAARQALEAIKEHPLSLVQVFASPHYDPEALLRGIRQEVGPAPLIGASAAGESATASSAGRWWCWRWPPLIFR